MTGSAGLNGKKIPTSELSGGPDTHRSRPDKDMQQGSSSTSEDPLHKSCWTALAHDRLSELDDLMRVGSSSTSKMSAARRQLAVELADLSRIRLELIARQNALQPVAAVPAELLYRVFHLSMDDRPRARSSKRERDQKVTLGWIKLTHVCRHWRTVALNNPRLWVDVCVLPLAAEVCLSRSQAAPINIVFDERLYDYAPPYAEAAKTALLLDLARARTIHIGAKQPTFDVMTSLICRKPATLLEEFLASTPSHGMARGIQSIQLPDDLFGGHAPKLRYLYLENCTISWMSPFLSGLKRLKVYLELSFVPVQPLPTYNQLLSALAQMPDLESLVLMNTLPMGMTELDTLTILPTVHLAYLTTLHLGKNPISCVSLLWRLDMPNVSDIYLQCEGGDVEEDLEEIIEHLGPLTFRQSHARLASLSFKYEKSVFTINAESPSDSHDPRSRGIPLKIKLEFGWPNISVENCVVTMTGIVHLFDIDHVTDLELGFQSQELLTTEDFLHACGGFVSVRTLTLTSCQIHHILPALLWRFDHKSYVEGGLDDSAGELFLPQLSTLELKDINLMATTSSGTAVWVICREVLRARSEITGAPLELLFIEQCTITMQAADDLKKLGPFNWDGEMTRATVPTAHVTTDDGTTTIHAQLGAPVNITIPPTGGSFHIVFQ